MSLNTNQFASFLLIAISLLFNPFGGSSYAEEPKFEHDRRPQSKQPNIVFFLADDQRNDTLGCAGHPIVKTPNIDQLASEGVRFNNCFVSHSICWVSRTTILSGLTARSFGKRDAPDQAKPEAVEQLVTDHLKQAGYRTGYFGKWHAKMPKGYRPGDHFDQFKPIGRNPYLKKQPDGSTRHETELIVDHGIEFLRTQPKDKPFMLNLWFNAAHAEDGDRRPGVGHFPWPKSVDGMYEDLAMPLPRLNDPAIFESQPEFLQTTLNRERFFWRWDTPEKYQTNMRAYFRMLSGIDHAIGRFVKELETLGLSDNTIIVYSGDNGYYMGDRGFAGKWSHYEQSLRVPLIVFDPRQPIQHRARVVDYEALNLDFPSTFLDWAGHKIPEHYQGKSLKPIVDGGAPTDWRTQTFHEHVAIRNRIPAFEGVRTREFKYVRYIDQDPPYEMLHDLKNDPDELVNLVNAPKFQDVLVEYRTRCDKTVNQYGGALSPFKAPNKAPKKRTKPSANKK